MKKILFLSFVGLTTLFFGCSDDPSPLAPPADASISSSSFIWPGVSSSNPKNGSTVSSSSVIINKIDTIRKQEIINIPAPGVDYPNTVEEKMFCWNTGCEATVKPRSSSSKARPKSSSSEGGTPIDEPENKAPTINGMSMTDMRDNKTYTLIQIGGKLWMAQDMNYEIANSECFNEKNENCATHGRLYTFNAAQKACPLGWHLPTREEAQAALNDESVPWSYSGRCKDGTCDFLGDMGFHWTSATPQSGDKNFDTNTGSSYTVIIVEKDPEYAGEKEQKFFQVDSKTKRFSVRCVQN